LPGNSVIACVLSVMLRIILSAISDIIDLASKLAINILED
jgi:hypothetical protein